MKNEGVIFLTSGVIFVVALTVLLVGFLQNTQQSCKILNVLVVVFFSAIWALVVILHILMFFYWTYEIMVVFLAYPVKTDISVVEKESITLPVVTICPLNPLRYAHGTIIIITYTIEMK